MENIVSVLELNSLVSDLESSEYRLIEKTLLSEKPARTNYIFVKTIGLLGCKYKFLRTAQFEPTTFPIREHLQIMNLTDECKMELTPSQYEIYSTLNKH